MTNEEKKEIIAVVTNQVNEMLAAIKSALLPGLISYWISVVVLTGVLIWGLKLLSKELQSPAPGTQSGDKSTLLRQALTDPNSRGTGKPPEGSFSRVAGALGAVGIAAAFVAFGYYVIYALHFIPGADVKAKFDGLGYYFLAGAAMFLPYAFDKLSGIFK